MDYEKPDYPPGTPDVHWAPNSRRLVAVRTTVVPEPRVTLVESRPPDRLQPRVHSYPYLKPGDAIPVRHLHLFDLDKQIELPLDNSLYSTPWSLTRWRWSDDSRHFYFLYNQRGHQVLRMIAIDTRDGKTRAIVEETSDTFIDYTQKTYLRILPDRGELIWMSERDGWNHLYLYDKGSGKLKNQITQGEWVVRRVESIDEVKRRITFRACGIYPEQDPYYEHYCHIGLDGSDLTVLTKGNGTHRIQYSPDRRWLMDTWSRVDRPPVHELRDAENGSLICKLDEADGSEMLDGGDHYPERFTAKGRDGKTDIYGVIYRPPGLDPNQQYPVIENIYAGPPSYHVPKAFHAPDQSLQEFVDSGFVVVIIDGMGTNWRSKAFHDVTWKNLADAGFPDRIAWIRAAAKTRPWIDLDRVGIYGGSAGGQNAMRALLDYSDFYQVAAADCGCHDNRMDKIWWNEAWMGWPVDDSYSRSSNVVDAHKLRGHLLLSVGELDRNVDPASTYPVVDALRKANREFDLLVMTGVGHGAGETDYGRRVRLNFFKQHLLNNSPD